MKRYILIAFAFLALAACEKDPNNTKEEKIKPAKYSVSGKVEKGPFVSGSTINLQPLDIEFNAVGTNFHGEIVDNAGNFSLGEMTLDTPYATMTANGYFYNEVENQLSNGTLTLNSIVDLRKKSSVNVNILTHLKYYRVQKLLSIGQSFAEADKQAQEELMRAFGLEQYNTGDFSQYSIVSGTDQAAALISISSLLLVGRKEAALTEYLATLSKEFGDNGFFSVTTKDIMDSDRFKLIDRLETIAKNIEEKYSSLDQTVTVKDLAFFFDWDGDGVAGNEIAAGDDAVKLETSSIEFPSEGGTKRIHITSSIPVSLSQYGGPNESYPYIDDTYSSIFSTGNVSIKTSIENDDLIVTATPAGYRIMNGTTVNLYDFRNKVVASLNVSQLGRENGSIFGAGVESVFGWIMNTLADSFSEYLKCDISYSRLYNYYEMPAPLNTGNGYVYNLWKKLYQGIGRVDSVINVFESQEGSLASALVNPIAALKSIRALYYYKLMSFWSSVPYITPEMRANMQSYTVPQNDIIAALKVDLDDAISKLPDKKNVLVEFNPDTFLDLSKDVPRFVMGKIYLMIGDYDNAKSYLDPIVGSGYYSMTNHQYVNGFTLADDCADEELVWGLPYTLTKSSVPCYPVLTYSDLLLDMCEICMKRGEYAKAQEYMNIIRVAYAQGLDAWYGEDSFLNALYEWRRETINGRGEFFDFLRRTGQAKSRLGLEDYQLLFPIPAQEVATGNGITQNPGY